MGAVWRALRVVCKDSRQDCRGSVEGFGVVSKDSRQDFWGSVEGFEGSKLGF